MKGILTGIVFALVFAGCLIIAVWARRLGLPATVGYLFYVPVVACVILLLLLAAIMRSMPAKLTLAPLQGQTVSPQVNAMIANMQENGFRSIRQPMVGNTHPPVILVPLLLDEGIAYGVVFQAVVDPQKIGIDVGSVLETTSSKNLTTLTTTNLIEGGVVEPDNGSFVQVFCDEDVRSLLQQHRAAIEFLRQNGVATKSVSESEFDRYYCDSFDGIRRKFLTNPIWHTMLATFRTLTKQSPYLGPIQHQNRAQVTLENRRRGFI